MSIKIFLITDTHFDHQLMVEKGIRQAGFENRILKAISQVTSDKDVLIHLGDVCWKNDRD